MHVPRYISHLNHLTFTSIWNNCSEKYKPRPHWQFLLCRGLTKLKQVPITGKTKSPHRRAQHTCVFLSLLLDISAPSVLKKAGNKAICKVSQVKCFMLSQCISTAVCLRNPQWPFSAPHSPLMKQAVKGGHKRYHCNREPLIELAGGPASPSHLLIVQMVHLK